MLFNNLATGVRSVAAILLCVAAAFATPPSNDDLANATTLSGANGSATSSNVEATRETGEFTHTMSSANTVFNTVWFNWTAPQSKPVILTVTSSAFDPSAAVYVGNAYPLTQIMLNNDFNGQASRIEFAAVAGVTYRIVVGAWAADSVTGGTFDLNWQQLDHPSNDDFAQAATISGDSGFVAVTTQNALPEASEPQYGVGNSIWFAYTNTSGRDVSLTFSTENSMDALVDTTLGVYTGSAVSALTPIVRNNDNISQTRSKLTFLARQNVTYRIAVDAATLNSDRNIHLSWDVTRALTYTDFGTTMPIAAEVNYDECADVSVFRPSTGVWYSLNSEDRSVTAFKFGQNGDRPVPFDFDGDGRTDYAVTRDEGGLKKWYIRSSFDGSVRTVQWGIASDREVPGDFDHDGRADIAVFRPSNNVWYIWRSSDQQFTIKEFGLAGDVPVLGDFKGTPDGNDIAVFRPSTGTWYVFDGVNTLFLPFGSPGDIPLPANFDLDGKTDLAVFRPSEGLFIRRNSANGLVFFTYWGLSTDIPMTADFDRGADGLGDLSVYRPSDNVWYRNRNELTVQDQIKFGTTGDIQIASFMP